MVAETMVDSGAFFVSSPLHPPTFILLPFPVPVPPAPPTPSHQRNTREENPTIQADAKCKLIESYAVTDARVHDAQMLEPLVDGTEGMVYADSAYQSAEAEAMLDGKEIGSPIHERAFQNRPLRDEQKETNRQKSKVRARMEHVFEYMSQTMNGFYLRYLG